MSLFQFGFNKENVVNGNLCLKNKDLKEMTNTFDLSRDDDEEEDDDGDYNEDDDDDDYDDDQSRISKSKRTTQHQEPTSQHHQRTTQHQQPTSQHQHPTAQFQQPLRPIQIAHVVNNSTVKSLCATTSLSDLDEDELEKLGENIKGWNCNKIRQMINQFLATKEMTQTKFLIEIGGVNNNSFQRFMKLRGPMTGCDNGTYRGSIGFFNFKEKSEKLAKSSMTSNEKKRKREENNSKNSALSDLLRRIESITLPMSKVKEEVIGYSTYTYSDHPIYDSVVEVKKHALSFKSKYDVSTTAFLRMINVNMKSWNSFLEFGPANKQNAAMMQPGAGNGAYPKAYYFLERIRIAENEPISKKRKEFEVEHPNGYSLKHDNGRTLCYR
jgi:hypothetical protein